MANGELHRLAERAARSEILNAAAKLFSIVTPLLFVPLLIWLFSTVQQTSLKVTEQGERLTAITVRVETVEDAVRDTARVIDERSEQGRREWGEIRERLVRVETLNELILEQLQQLSGKRDVLRIQPNSDGGFRR